MLDGRNVTRAARRRAFVACTCAALNNSFTRVATGPRTGYSPAITLPALAVLRREDHAVVRQRRSPPGISPDDRLSWTGGSRWPHALSLASRPPFPTKRPNRCRRKIVANTEGLV